MCIRDRPQNWTFTLPTEAEWAYACRAGTKSKFSWGNTFNSNLANTKTNGLNKTVEVGSYSPNPWGFYDMHGNVWEWCLDKKGDYPKQKIFDPFENKNGSGRVLRGGSWYYEGEVARSSSRWNTAQDYKHSSIGFRVAFKQVN